MIGPHIILTFEYFICGYWGKTFLIFELLSIFIKFNGCTFLNYPHTSFPWYTYKYWKNVSCKNEQFSDIFYENVLYMWVARCQLVPCLSLISVSGFLSLNMLFSLIRLHTTRKSLHNEEIFLRIFFKHKVVAKSFRDKK